MTPEPAKAPAAFRRAVAALRATTVDPAILVEEIGAPVRLAPHAFALAAEVDHGDAELANGRFILLHDPGRPEAWDGDTRVVIFVTAPVEAELIADPLLPEVGWAWLLDALAARGAAHSAAGGTVTRTSSTRFGSMATEPDTTQVELRCSWTVTDGELGAHLLAFADVLCALAGLPPAEPGVARLPIGRGHR